MLNKILIISIISILLLSMSYTLSGTVVLPRTGQTTCYDGTGAIPCENSGQDGDTLAGAAWPSPRFTDNGDGTITDNLTGLMVLKDGNCFPSRKWLDAQIIVDKFNANPIPDNCREYKASYDDWYIPNYLELESLVNAEESNPASWLNSQGFWEMQGIGYWSSTSDDLHPEKAIFIDMFDGAMYRDDKDINGKLLPVRAGQKNHSDPAYPANLWKTGQSRCYSEFGAILFDCRDTGQDGEIQAGVPWPIPRFTDNGDNSVTDNLTGNIWLKNANCMGSYYPYPGFDKDGVVGDGRVNWEHALEFVELFNSRKYAGCGSGKDDWRLPNRKEFLSLLDASQSVPPVPSDHPFFNIMKDIYWTSTTVPSAKDNAWSLHEEGYLLKSDKSSNNYVWLVRGGGPVYYNYLPIVSFK